MAAEPQEPYKCHNVQPDDRAIAMASPWRRDMLPDLRPAVMNEDQSLVTSKSDVKGKGPVKRNSEIRKEQNRVASRNYREKRRQKLALLDQILKTEDGSEQSIGEPSGSDGGGSIAGGNSWSMSSMPLTEDNTFHQHQTGMADSWTGWLLPTNSLDAEPGLPLDTAMLGQDWSSLLETVPESGDLNAAIPPNTLSNNLALRQPNQPDPVPPDPWLKESGESFYNMPASDYRALESAFAPCAASVGLTPEQAMLCIMRRIGNMTPAQKWALISFLQQDTSSFDASSAMHASGSSGPI